METGVTWVEDEESTVRCCMVEGIGLLLASRLGIC